MFWDAVLEGLKVLTHWQTYVAGLEYIAIYMLPMVGIGLLMQSENKAATSIGCLSMLIAPLFQVAALIVFVLTIWPIILGTSDQATWAFPFQLIRAEPLMFVKLVGVLAIAAIVLAFFPIVGRFQSAHTLLLGAIALAFVLSLMDSAVPGSFTREIQYWPGLWFVLGLLVTGALMSWVGLLVSSLVAMPLENVAEGLEQLLVFPLAAIFGFIPVFMYGAWLGAQLRVG